MPKSKIRNRVCQHCGTPFILGEEHRLEKYCSIKCRTAYGNANGGKKYRNSAKGKATMREWRLRTVFGITTEQFDQMFKDQGECCAICETKEPTGYNWHVDHCHASGHVRGILCSNCNMALGLMNDDREVLKRAREYLLENS